MNCSLAGGTARLDTPLSLTIPAHPNLPEVDIRSILDLSQALYFCGCEQALAVMEDRRRRGVTKEPAQPNRKARFGAERFLYLTGAMVGASGMLAFIYLAVTRGFGISLVHLDFWWGSLGR